MRILKSIFYFIIDFLHGFRGVPRTINNVAIRFGARWSKYYNDGYEKTSFNFFKNNIKPGDVVLDIGAHIGLYTTAFSQLTGKDGLVFCIEPTPSTFKILNQTIKLNNLHNVKCLNEAISDKEGKIEFNLTNKSGKASNANSLVNISQTKNTISVISTTIDSIREKHNLKIDILKIDVEGAELLALLGAKKTFELDKPKGILALHPRIIKTFGHQLESIWDCLINYNVKITYKGEPINKEDFCSKEELFDVEFC